MAAVVLQTAVYYCLKMMNLISSTCRCRGTKHLRRGKDAQLCPIYWWRVIWKWERRILLEYVVFLSPRAAFFNFYSPRRSKLWYKSHRCVYQFFRTRRRATNFCTIHIWQWSALSILIEVRVFFMKKKKQLQMIYTIYFKGSKLKLMCTSLFVCWCD